MVQEAASLSQGQSEFRLTGNLSGQGWAEAMAGLLPLASSRLTSLDLGYTMLWFAMKHSWEQATSFGQKGAEKQIYMCSADRTSHCTGCSWPNHYAPYCWTFSTGHDHSHLSKAISFIWWVPKKRKCKGRSSRESKHNYGRPRKQHCYWHLKEAAVLRKRLLNLLIFRCAIETNFNAQRQLAKRKKINWAQNLILPVNDRVVN